MSNPRPPAKRPAASRPANRQAAPPNRLWWILTTVVVVIGLAVVFTLASRPKPAQKAGPAPATLIAKVRSIPASVFAQVGAGTAAAAPKRITAPALTDGTKPEILYVGAEYCPYCATERWPMVIALSRFGSFRGLRITHSSSSDVYANTATFSFHGATYTSPYLTFSGVELESNQLQGGSYPTLDTLTPSQSQIYSTFDAPPYTTEKGGIPFIDFGGKFLVSGVTYDPGVLQGKTHDQIAAALSDPSTAISKGAIGAANTLTAAMCSLTGNQPTSVCATPTISGLESSLR